MSEPQTLFKPDRGAYLRAYAWMAAIAMAAGMGVLWVMGNPHAWTGAVGGLAAIALRGWYLASDELSVVWRLTDRRLTGPAWRDTALDQITVVRTLGSAVQVITQGGDKHLLKYLPDPVTARTQIEAAVTRAKEARR